MIGKILTILKFPKLKFASQYFHCQCHTSHHLTTVCVLTMMRESLYCQVNESHHLTTYDDARKAMVQTAARTPRKAASKERKQRRVTGLL